MQRTEIVLACDRCGREERHPAPPAPPPLGDFFGIEQAKQRRAIEEAEWQRRWAELWPAIPVLVGTDEIRRSRVAEAIQLVCRPCLTEDEQSLLSGRDQLAEAGR